MRIFLEKYKSMLIMMFLYWFICFIIYLTTKEMRYAYLSWNIILAGLPLFFIGKAVVTIKEKQKKPIIWLVLWLFFFPNSVYMVTGFIHLANESFVWIVERDQDSSYTGVVYSNDIFVWMKLLIISFGFLLAMLVGLESLHLFEKIIRKKYSKMICYFVIFGVAFLTSIGVYIGRFLRFNSWDVIFSPFELLKETLGLGMFGIQFIIMFTIFVLSNYILYKIFKKQIL